MTDERLLDIYHALSERHRLPTLRPLAVTVESRRLSDPAAADEYIRAFGADQGWVCFQSRVRWFTPGDPFPQDGTVLSAELAAGPEHSLHLRQDGAGGWLAVRFSTGTGEPFLAEQTRILSEPPELGALCYQVLWQHDPDRGYRAVAARFTGFAGPGES